MIMITMIFAYFMKDLTIEYNNKQINTIYGSNQQKKRRTTSHSTHKEGIGVKSYEYDHEWQVISIRAKNLQTVNKLT